MDAARSARQAAGTPFGTGILPRRELALLPRPLRPWLAAALGLFTLWRLALVWTHGDLLRRSCDGGVQWNMAASLVRGKGLAVTDPYYLQCSGITLGPSHHYGPLLSLFEAPFIAAFGDTLQATRVVLTVLLLGVTFSVWWTTRDLFGPDAALLASGWCLANGILLHYGYDWGYADSLTVALFAWTLWAILRSLERSPFILVAGLAAALGYLSKSSLGWFFLLAGAGGVGWRLWHQGTKALRNGWYLAAVAVFASIGGAWMLRNVALFWDRTPSGLLSAWQTSPYNSAAFQTAFGDPAQLLVGLAAKLPLFALQTAAVAGPLWPGLRRALAAWRREDASLLWFSVALLLLIGWLSAGAFLVVERTAYLWPDALRYTLPVGLCLVWLAMAHASGRIALWRWAALAVAGFFLWAFLDWLHVSLAPPWGIWPRRS